MLYKAYYAIRAKAEILECPDIDREFAELLLDERPIYCKPEGGRPAWPTQDHMTLMKLLFLAEQKSEYDDPFFENAPLSAEFFDKWWVIERFDYVEHVENVLDNLNSKVLDQFVASGKAHVDEALVNACRREPRTEFWVDHSKYRVWWDGDVIGWIEEPIWDLPYLRGKWSPTINPQGKRFAKEHAGGEKYTVVIDGDHYLHGEFVDNDGTANVRIEFASDKLRRESGDA